MLNAVPLFGRAPKSAVPLEFRAFPRTGPVRWLLEARYRRPWHLKTWPRSGLKAHTFFCAAWAFSIFGILPPARKISVLCDPASLYFKLRIEFDRIGVSLGTPGRNRKIVVFAETADRSVFFKIPTSPESSALVDNEARTLSELGEDPVLSQIVPKANWIEGHLAVENLQKEGVRFGVLPETTVKRIHDLMFSRTATLRSVDALLQAWQQDIATDTASGIREKRTSEEARLFIHNRNALYSFLNVLDREQPIQCYMAHGDFTRWNVLLSPRGEPRIIDWELYGLRTKYFDLIHYFVSTGILVLHKPAAGILTDLRQIGRWIGVDEGMGIADWNRYVGLYFAYQSFYYGSLFERQKDLHYQAIWQLRTWAECLNTFASDSLSSAYGRRHAAHSRGSG